MAEKPNRTDTDLPEIVETTTDFDLLAALWQRKGIVVCVFAVAFVLGYLYFLRSTPIYQSTSQILLVKREADLPIARVEEKGTYEDALSTHMLVICSPLIVGRAVEKHGLASLPSLQEADNPTAAIIAGLKASRAGSRDARDPNVIDLTYEGPDREDCAAVLDAVIQTYKEFLGETYQDFNEEAAQLISQAKGVLHKQLTEKEAAYRKFRQESPLLWKGAEGANMHETRMAQIEAARAEVLVENAQLKARIDAIETALNQEGNQAALTMLIGKSDSDGSAGTSHGPIGAFDERLFTALVEEQMLLQDYGRDHPKVMAVHKKMDLMRKYLGDAPTAKDGQPAEFLLIYIGSLRQELKIGQQRQREYDSLFQQERESAKSLATVELADESYRNEIARTQKLFEGVIKRLEEINLIKDYGGISTQVISPPAPGQQVKPKLALILIIAGVLGLLAGVGLAYVVEVADKSFRSPDDIRRQLGLPPIGHIPMIVASETDSAPANGEDAKPDLDPILCTFHHPKSRDAEGYRAVRTSLYFSTRGEGHRVIQVTSPDAGDGKTTLAANLAVSIADSGKSVLLMDADFRRPKIHKFFAVDNSKGLSSVISGDAKFLDSVQRTAVEHLSVVPCGPRPRNPAELLTSPRFEQLIDSLRNQYEFVIIDTPPLLAVTDPSTVAPRVDAVLLVMRLTKTARHGMLRAAEILNSLGARVLGVVVNGVGRTSAYGYGYRYGYGRYRYGYGGYRYGYGYGNGYGYGYGSHKDGENVYYTDEKSPTPRPLGRVFNTSSKPTSAAEDSS